MTVIYNMLDCEEMSGETSTTIVKGMPMVEYEEHQIFKATLIFQLNASLFLYKDKLMQVKNSIYFKNVDDYISASSCPLPCWLVWDMMWASFCVQNFN